MDNQFPLQHTIESKCGRARLTYNPEFDSNRPWISYKSGTAGMHFHSPQAGVQQLKRDGYRFDKDACKVPA